MAALERTRESRSDRLNCPICSQRRLGGGEIYLLPGDGGISIFDVEKAKQIVSDGRTPRLMPGEILERLLQENSFELAHLRHVDLRRPGIVGQRSAGPFLLDGIHRGARAVRQNHNFYAFFINAEETQSCLLSQDIAETDIGIATRELRKLLADHSEVYDLEIEIDGGAEAIAQIRKLLTPEENRRITITTTQFRRKAP